MAELYRNNARSTLASGISAADTSLTVQAGDGAKLFPPTSSPDFFRIFLFNKTTGDVEYCKVTGVSGDTLTLGTRAFEDVGNVAAVAKAFNAGDPVELRPTRGFFESLTVTDALVQSDNYNFQGTDTGGVNAYAVALTPTVTSYLTGLRVTFVAANTNTASSTLAVDGLAAKTIKKFHDQNLAAGDIEAGGMYEVRYDGTNFQLLSATGDAATLSGQPLSALASLAVANIFTQNQEIEKSSPILTLDASSGTNGLLRFHYIGSTNRGGFVQLVNSSSPGYVRLYKYNTTGGFAGHAQIYDTGQIDILNNDGTLIRLAGDGNITLTATANGSITLNPAGTGTAKVGSDDIVTASTLPSEATGTVAWTHNGASDTRVDVTVSTGLGTDNFVFHFVVEEAFDLHTGVMYTARNRDDFFASQNYIEPGSTGSPSFTTAPGSLGEIRFGIWKDDPINRSGNIRWFARSL